MIDHATITGKIETGKQSWWSYEAPVEPMHETPRLSSQQEIEMIDAVLSGHLGAMRDSLLDMIAALLTVIIGLFSLAHGIIRFTYNLVGVVVWACGVLLMGLNALKERCVARTSSSVFLRREARKNE